MKVLSVRQPWAFLIVSGIKDVENRTWFTDYQGPLLIHAGKTWDFDGADFLRAEQPRAWAAIDRHFGVVANAMACRPITRCETELGAIIGQVTLEGCYHHSVPFSSPWAERGLWHWHLHSAIRFTDPIPLRGSQGLFNYCGPLPGSTIR